MSKTVIFSAIGALLILGAGAVVVIPKLSSNSGGNQAGTSATEVSDNISSDSNNVNAATPVTKKSASSDDCEVQYHGLLDTYGRNFDDCALKLSTANTCAKNTNDTKKKNIVLILDDSGSMAGSVGGEVKMEAVKNAAKNFISTLDPNYNMSFVLYGHKGNNTTSGKTASCGGIEEIYPLGHVVASTLIPKVDALKANGWTPLGGAIEKAGAILKGKTADKNDNLIILLTDGEETCGGDAPSAAKKLFAQQEKIVTNVISFDLSVKEASSLQAISAAGHGTFISAANEADLTNALNENKNFMAGFNCYMEQSSVWLSNDIDVENKHGECENRLETQEKLPLTQAIDFQNGTTESCTDYLESTYEKRYQSLKQMIEDAYNSRKGDSKSENKKLEQTNADKDDNAPYQP